jgi:hypothetical protein
VAEPSAVMKKATEASVSPGTVGSAANRLTWTVNRDPFPIGRCGVITSSPSFRLNFAPAPFTDTPPTLLPAKSRSNRESD